MNLKVGIVGLPNSGKSTIFNALLSRQIAPVANYPFTTIEPHQGVVALPDDRLRKLSAIVKPDKIVPATVTFVDIAGLVKNAHQGEGLGNQFLGYIRQVDAICHVVRVFEDQNVPHVNGKVDPMDDIEIVNIELEMANIVKPTIYVLNVSEKQLADGTANVWLAKLKKTFGARVQSIVVCAKLEMELTDLKTEEREEYLVGLGIKESGLEKLINVAYKILGLITFYTIKGGKEIRAFSLQSNQTVIEAAGMIHTDFAKKFIKAEVISFDDFVKVGSWQTAKEKGLVKLVGKDYQVCDGDIIEILAST